MVNQTELMKLGAKARLAELEMEIAELRQLTGEYGELGNTLGIAAEREMRAEAAELTTPKRRKRAPMSAAAKKALSRRMKAWWKAKRV